jgi:hypothetical protein
MRLRIQFLLSTLLMFGVFTCFTVVLCAQPEIKAFNECEGDGCAQVTITWDDAKQLYKVQNNSADRWVKVEASNLAASASLCLAPTKTDHLSLTTVVGAFRAAPAEENCGRKP